MIGPMSQTQDSVVVRAVRLALLATACGAAVLLAAGWWPAESLAGAGGVRTLASACVAGAAGSLAGNLPAMLSISGPPQRFVSGFFLGLTSRFVLTILVAFAAYRLLGDLPYFAFLVWVGIAQTLHLAVDTAVLLRCAPGTAGTRE